MTEPLLNQRENQPASFDDVLAKEIELVRKRLEHSRDRESKREGGDCPARSSRPSPNGESTIKPQQAALELDLVGLALSGGGIRSATFNLGVLQGFAHLGLLQRFDYLSTVSGGGYIGGWLAAWIKREGDPKAVEQQLKPNRQQEAEAQRLLKKDLVVEDEPEPVHHLRSYSNYLSPRLGLFSIDTWTLVAIYLRNLLLNLAILVPLLLAGILLCRLLLSVFYVDVAPSWCVVLLAVAAALLLVFGLVSLGSDLRGRFDQLHQEHGGAPRGPLHRRSRLGRLFFYGAQTPRQEVARLMHLLVFLPLLLGAVLSSWLFHCTCQGTLLGDLHHQWQKHPWMVPTVGGVAVGLVFGVVRWLVGVRVVRQAAPHTGRTVKRARFDWTPALYSTVSGFLVGLLFLFVWGSGLAILDALQLPPAVLTLGPPLVLLLACLAIATEVGLHGRILEEDAREWWGTVAGYLLIYACSWLALFVLSIYSGWLLEWVGNRWIKTGLAASWLTIAVSGARSGGSAATFNGQGGRWREWLGVLAPPVFAIGLAMVVALLANSIVDGGDGDYWQRLRQSNPWFCLLALLASAGLGYALSGHVDVNLFSMHGTYANRLIRCYLGASRRKLQWRRRDADDPWLESGKPTPRGREANGRATLDSPIARWLPGRGGAATGNDEPRERQDDLLTGFDPDDDILLSDLLIGKAHPGTQMKTYWGPFLIVNSALNLVAGEELAWQERKAESFVLTPLAGGSKSTGYSWLPSYNAADPEPGDLTLGRALAISGAAASPNMGYHSSVPLGFLMTVFNLRLGWWMENPREANWRARGPARRDLLLHELLGQTNEKGRYVYLSDGGHFENLGVYELVRRRCRFIVACDADADPTLEFFDLGNLIRKCRNDFGIRIDIDINPIRRQPASGRSRWHCAIGTIHYDDVDRDALPGMLVYLKASLTGDEPSDVLAYAAQHSSFPHQSTMDQFFTESQFESYRALGSHIVMEVFGKAIRERDSKVNKGPAAGGGEERTDKRLFSRLRRRWFPPPPGLEDHFFATAKDFLAVQQHLRRDALLHGLSRDLYPELQDFAAASPLVNGDANPPQHQIAHPAAQEQNQEQPQEQPQEQLQGQPQEQDQEQPQEQSQEQDCAELHAVCEMLQVMENAWLRLRLDQYFEHPMNRGWMTVFRRWTNSEAFSKYWPCLRGEFSQEFVQFCEKELKLVLWDIRAVRNPDETKTIVASEMFSDDEVAELCETLKDNDAAIERLDQEFAFEWYSEDDAKRGIKELVERAKETAARLKCDPFVWVIWVTSASKFDGGEPGEGNIARPVGVLLLFDAPEANPQGQADKTYEFFVWMLGPYRNQGIGRDPDCVQQVLDELWKKLGEANSGRPFTLFVRYPRGERADGEEPLERDLWLNFFHYYDFYQVRPEGYRKKNDIILACHSDQRRRRLRAQPLRTYSYRT